MYFVIFITFDIQFILPLHLYFMPVHLYFTILGYTYGFPVCICRIYSDGAWMSPCHGFTAASTYVLKVFDIRGLLEISCN
jgi:hypothetical protein